MKNHDILSTIKEVINGTFKKIKNYNYASRYNKIRSSCDFKSVPHIAFVTYS
jgi:hypothetical protein